MTTPKDLTRADFLEDEAGELEAGALVPVDVPHPTKPDELWGRCYLRVWSGKDRDDWEVRTYELTAQAPAGDDYILARNVSAELVSRTACDASGQLLFPTAEDAAALGVRRGLGGVLRYLYERAAKLNRVRWEDLQELRGKSGAE